METIDLTPSPEGYKNMLRLIIESNPDPVEVAWARTELATWQAHYPEAQ